MRVINAALIGLFAVVICWLGHSVWLSHKYDHGYARVARGDSEAVVRRLFGDPREIKGPPDNISWGSDASLEKNGGRCVREFWYPRPLDFTGGVYTVGFDSGNRVVSKYQYQSP